LTVKAPSQIALIGPQHTTPDVGTVVAELGIKGPVALVRAGYQEFESDDAPLVAALGVPTVNLTLHARSNAVFKNSGEFAEAYPARQQRLRLMQGFYRTRLDGTEDAAKKISLRYVDSELLDQEEKVSVDLFRHIDTDHIERCQAVRAAFDKNWPASSVELVEKHRAEVRELMASCDALVIAGGHVASLLNRLELFDVLGNVAGKTIIAWSAGAMCLTDRIVLFHDFPPYGSDIAQELDSGVGLVPGYVVLPDPRRRVNLDEKGGIQRFARRMAPATCVAMDHGARLILENGDLRYACATRLTTAGDAERDWHGEPSRFSTPYMHGIHV
jgi:hypothetical protein